ncbi:MAG TPA: hypothetical protein ENJ18_04630, partial [Nannocystis exedens]|nr:hypothetical protein [Nannocystis exedens]
MDFLMAGRTPLVLALLCTAGLACATSNEGSFTGASLSAGPMTATDSSGGEVSSGSNGNSDSESSSGHDSDGGSGSGTGTTGTTTDDTGTTTTGDTSTTGLDCDDGLGNLCGNPYDLGSLAEGDTAMSQT